jgi:hypothetical protein
MIFVMSGARQNRNWGVQQPIVGPVLLRFSRLIQDNTAPNENQQAVTKRRRTESISGAYTPGTNSASPSRPWSFEAGVDEP